ncbi:ATP-dependent nuclease [Actinomadura rugatobispora]|uniref:ATP-dependent endonuclease n=1 Tax=Actinomadura rugatobispora TaxID=1994 RepID=A0ABW0ZZK2_9ACTN|nr:hypothetical protein GCM10010200_007520 [Actinomadura rugatobispora]
MRPLRVSVRNVRGARATELHLRPFSALIGPNNAGKSTLLDAVRLFYGSLTWDPARDRPWDLTSEEAHDPSWVEISYVLNELDLKELDLEPGELADDEIRPLDGDVLTVRRYLTGDGDRRQGDYYFIPANEDEAVVATGWREPPSRLGHCVYVPAVTSVEDQTAMSAPSPLRDVMLLAFTDPRVDGFLGTINHGLQGLRQAMESGPVRRLEERLGDALRPWGLSARVRVGELTDEFILGNLIDLSLSKGGSLHSMEAEGSGVQRALIAGLIQAAAQLRADGEPEEFRWILFEEPEAFLHPAQIVRLAHDLRRIAGTGNTAVTITTHDPKMLSASRTPPEALARVHRPGAAVRVTSPSPLQVTATLEDVRTRSLYTRAAHACFRDPAQAPPGDEENRVLYDLDPRRAAAFFADRVIVVEGFSDVAVFEWLDARGLLESLGPNLGVLDAGGKYELHRAVSTLSMFQIPHVVLWDEDAPMKDPGTSAERRAICRDRASLEALRAAATVPGATLGAVRLHGTIERWLGLPEEQVPAWKALNLGTALDETYGDSASVVRPRVEVLLEVIHTLFDGGDVTRLAARPAFAGCLISQDPAHPATTVDFQAEIAALPLPACRCAAATQ